MGSWYFLPDELVMPVESEEMFRRPVDPSDQDEEERLPVPVGGEELRTEEVMRAPDMQDMPTMVQRR